MPTEQEPKTKAKKAKKAKYVWVEWRHKGSGPRSWNVEEVVWYDDLVEALRTHFGYKAKDYSYSEMFRGFDWNVIKRPTRQFLERKIGSIEAEIAAAERELERLKDLSKKIPKDRWVYKDEAYTSKARMEEVMTNDARWAVLRLD